MTPQFEQRVLHRYEVTYFACSNCGLVQTESPYWLDEAYSNAIADSDTGIIVRNSSIARKLSAIIYLCLDRDGTYLDSAGGYGLLARMMRDAGFDFYWHDEYAENLFAKGFQQADMPSTPVAVTAFEVLEHVVDPRAFLEDALSSTSTGTVVLSTELFAGAPPLPGDWWYYMPETGQHISFYQRRTLEELARQLGVNLYSNNDLHVFSRNPISDRKFRLATGRWSWPLSLYIRTRLPSKTFDDLNQSVSAQ